MPNTKSAERRMRSSAKRNLHNQSIKHRLKSLEQQFVEAMEAGKREEAATALAQVASALDKAAKQGVIHKANASRKKSRLARQLNPAAAAAA